MSAFTSKTISDEKRLIRGENWLLARTILRGQWGMHSPPANVLMLAGPSPEEEIGCIRAVLPKAHITGVDVVDDFASAAFQAGANHCLHGDLLDIFPAVRRVKNEAGGWANFSVDWARPTGVPSKWTMNHTGPFPLVSAHEHPPDMPPAGTGFSVVDLDFCGLITPRLIDTVDAVVLRLRRRGLMMLTFAYGRDVSEVYDPTAWTHEWPGTATLTNQGLSKPAAGRLAFVSQRFKSNLTLLSACTYKGAETPMCSSVWMLRGPYESKGFHRRVAVEHVVSDDVDMMLASFDPTTVYALPAERIRAARARWAASKAVATRRGKLTR